MTDDVLGVIGTIAGPVAPGATNMLTACRAVRASPDVTNIGDVVANPTDILGNDLPDLPDATDSDDAVVDVVAPALSHRQDRGQRGGRGGRVHRSPATT